VSLDLASIRAVEIPDRVPWGGEQYQRITRRATAWLAARNAGRNLQLETSQLTVRDMTAEEREARRLRLQDRIGVRVKRQAVYTYRRSSSEAYQPKPAPTPPKPEPQPDPVVTAKATTPCRRRRMKRAKQASSRSPGFAIENLDQIIAKWLGIA
jgi:hypothetical protein